jgi:hypothetical protein
MKPPVLAIDAEQKRSQSASEATTTLTYRPSAARKGP